MPLSSPNSASKPKLSFASRPRLGHTSMFMSQLTPDCERGGQGFSNVGNQEQESNSIDQTTYQRFVPRLFELMSEDGMQD